MHTLMPAALSMAFHGMIAEVPQIDNSQYPFTLLQIVLVMMITGVVFWGVATWSTTKKLQPQLNEERSLRVQSEVKRQDEAQAAQEYREKTEHQLQHNLTLIASLEQQVATLKEQAASAAQEAADKITALQAEVTAAAQSQRDAETQSETAKTRITTLEAALEAEKGRIGAMQEAMEAKQDLAKQLAQELSSTRNAFAEERKAAQERENNLRSDLATHERLAANGQTMADVVNQELEKTRLAQAELEKESAAKLAELQRKLSAADQKSALLQKEIMALVGSGNASDAAEAVTHAEALFAAQERAKNAEKKIVELEAQLTQGDAGTRKRLREAEYKICELEFKLAQTDEVKS